MVAITSFGSEGLKTRLVTSPTRTPLKSTDAADRDPRSGPLKADLVGRGSAEGPDPVQPVDRGADRRGEQDHQRPHQNETRLPFHRQSLISLMDFRFAPAAKAARARGPPKYSFTQGWSLSRTPSSGPA